MTAEEQALLAAVEARFAVLGAGTPPWDDPHPGTESPAEEEYSRLLDPAKYRILAARARAWTEVLVAARLARVEEVAEPAVLACHPTTPLERSWWLRPVRAGALPLLVGLRSMDGVTETVTELWAAEPPVLVTIVPDCGCDACDEGSAGYLTELDEHVLHVVRGGFVRVELPGGSHATSDPNGYSASGFTIPDDYVAEVERARAGTSPYPSTSGRSWFVPDGPDVAAVTPATA